MNHPPHPMALPVVMSGDVELAGQIRSVDLFFACLMLSAARHPGQRGDHHAANSLAAACPPYTDDVADPASAGRGITNSIEVIEQRCGGRLQGPTSEALPVICAGESAAAAGRDPEHPRRGGQVLVPDEPGIWPSPQAGSQTLLTWATLMAGRTCRNSARVAQGGVGK